MDSQTRIRPPAPENDTNESAEQNIDENSSGEYEDTSPKLDSRMSDALELDDSANLEQAIRNICKKDGKMEKQFYQICPTSSPLSFEINISEVHNYLEKLDQSSIHSTASDTEMCAEEVNDREKTRNGLQILHEILLKKVNETKKNLEIKKKLGAALLEAKQVKTALVEEVKIQNEILSKKVNEMKKKFEIKKEFERLRQELMQLGDPEKMKQLTERELTEEYQKIKEVRQQIDALNIEPMSIIEANMSNGTNDVRAVSGTTYWSGDGSSSKIGSFIEESEIRQLAECRDIIENTPILRGGLAARKKRGLRENKAMIDQSSIHSTASDTEMCTEEVNDSEKTQNGPSRSVLSVTATKLRQELNEKMLKWRHLYDNVGGPVEHSNAFAETRDKPEASNESPKNTAHDLDLTFKRQETEKQSEVRQIESLQINLLPEYKLSRRNRAKGESKPVFDQRFKTALFCLAALLLLVLAFFGLAWLGMCLGMRLAQENSEELGNYKASAQRQMENFPSSLDAEIKQRRKTESELKLAQETLEGLRREKAITENSLTRALWFYSSLIVVGLVGLANLASTKNEEMRNKASTQREIEDLRKTLDAEIEQRRKTEGELKLAEENSEELRRDKATSQREMKDLRNSLDPEIKKRRKTENDLKLAQKNMEELQRKLAKEPFARSDVVIVKSEMRDRQMQNDAIQIMIESMKECTRASAVTKFISGKMREKYRGTEWICFISDGKPNPIVLDYNYSLSVYLKMDVVFIELICSVFDA